MAHVEARALEGVLQPEGVDDEHRVVEVETRHEPEVVVVLCWEGLKVREAYTRFDSKQDKSKR